MKHKYKTKEEAFADEHTFHLNSPVRLFWKLSNMQKFEHSACFGGFRGKTVIESSPIFTAYMSDAFSVHCNITDEPPVIDQYFKKVQDMGFSFTVEEIEDNKSAEWIEMNRQLQYGEERVPLISRLVHFDLSKISARELFVAGTFLRYIYEYPKNVATFFDLEKKHPESTSFQNLLLSSHFGLASGHTLPVSWAIYLLQKDVKEYLSDYPLPYIKMNRWDYTGDGKYIDSGNPVASSLAEHEYLTNKAGTKIDMSRGTYNPEAYHAMLCKENFLNSRYYKESKA